MASDPKKNKINRNNVEYICGKCGTIVSINQNSELTCPKCLFNIFYKKKMLSIKKIRAL
uniref:DNA-directed RNA polymerases I, II and III n=1 Tax=Amorphochlora amoebiformis TaxID=1561963 RepID=A0A0H5BI65_9EUKA|nr:DNA-directed RNA polymerases I, II and III [Amorphochlora amoebiformis]